MPRPAGHAVKLVSEDALLYETALKRRSTQRLALGIVLGLVALGLILASFIPIIAKSTIPLLWIEYANAHGWTKELQEIGTKLIANGRIEIYPLWVSYVIMAVGGVLGWLAAHIVRNRHSTTLLGDLLTKSYWLHFYWVKKPGETLVVNFHSNKKNPK
ncbi:hypothetical protein [Pseudomonas serbica]|uniref:hypothetical protein n=1 Tax=Pseudomonas serbica TaxID=2965074 RepID=UPI00237ADF5A|nr:hypothetical protein [Pseudomonas serbica]